MADNFGLKIGLEGEKEFKKALTEINQSFKVLGSEMKLVESQFSKNDDSADALAARHKVLTEQVEAQRKKVEMLKQALANAAESFGENDRRTQAWQIQLNNAQAALNGMERELSDNEEAMDRLGKEMDDTGDSADDLEEELDDAGDAADDSEGKFSKLGGTLKTVGVAMGACVAAAAAAAVSLGKAVIEAYGEYEQLVGGVDTLFQESSGKLQEYAANAYKTAGMSANDYMSTVTSFSASLIQSLGGDTEAAVKYADMAITDMADNANKMGTDIGLIQNAYQGFAKQNYTMLDNLKLGYGGTKEEMERLLADATAISGIEYDISSYADVVDAIHVIQESMGVAGATAAEAEHTIEGSLNSMKAAVANLVVGFGNADADIEQLCNNVVDAFQDVLTNITPVIENIIAALPTALNALLETVGELLPTLLETVVDLFSQVLNTLLTLLPELIPVVIEALLTIVNTLIENLPLLVEAAIQIVMSLVQGIGQALPTLIPAAIQAIITIVQSLIDSLPMILDAALQLITGLADGLLAAIPVLIAALPEIILSIINFILDAIPQIIETGIQLLTSLVAALPEIITAIVEAIPQIISGIIEAVLSAIPQIIQAGIDLLISLVQALPQIITTIVSAIPDIISGIVNAVINNIPLIVQAGIELLTSLIKNLPTIIVEIVKAVPQIITGIVNALGKGVSQLAEVGVNLVKGLWQGIQSLASWLWNKVSGWISSIWDGICDFFGIHSPSDEMAWIGEMLVKGLSGSIDANGGEAVKAAEAMSEDINDVMHGLAKDMETALPTDFNVDGNVHGTVSGGIADSAKASGLQLVLNITNFNNYSTEDIQQLTNEIMVTAGQFAKRKGVVFA
ncbi:phage tail protein [Neglectibacter timonensis]|uniref:Phage tail protein n=1 Tax=Neglectibacter timonensis TaxID=1776382 RepID=A0ABT1S086_9FIRM|nr:phage tail protein [Neglectibacter timonensis]MCQ4840341.1 phage tail protein [Neglectibacter timonensis]MCQ4843923.1 phage tail protein [Neglectibacter timonensis]